MRATRLTLICSGITHGVRKSGFPSDEPLEKRSVKLAQALRDHLADADRALCGPALRARQTAELLGLSATVRQDLRDQDYGIWSGKTLVEIEKDQPEAIAAWLTDPAFAPKGGESIDDVAERAAAFLDEMRAAPGHVIAVIHAAVVRAAILNVLSAPLTAFWRIDVPPLSVTDLRCDGRRWVLRAHGLPSLELNGESD
ncbi:histidine phosphatase family protein [Pseudaminobacter soli (ex Li et al. 2025)]|uniref:Histidine phosphatase family protein n=1 Tax=Pseudaminobacter soli (ex Li et al. 2025) TaxID=1295366 RepID=A0A2P7SKU7_9HYPH|nr:histidine phosphatase family protein [Mesorhizobium soli]PSJ63120.1 histidine phosphatase family protein [Mesorhizobium soli]